MIISSKIIRRVLSGIFCILILMPSVIYALSSTDPKPTSTPKIKKSDHSIGLASPNLTFYQPPGWLNPIVVSTVPNTNTEASKLYTTDTLYVDFNVQNNGSVATSARFYSQVDFDGVKFDWWTDPPLNPGYYTSMYDAYFYGFSAGWHTITVTIDSTSAIAESNESDNQTTKMIYLYDPTTPAPILDGPANGTVMDDATPDLAWHSNVGVTKYHIQIDDNSDFSSPYLDFDYNISNNYTPTLSYGTWYWRVKSQGTDGVWSYYSNTWSFTLAVSYKPNLTPYQPSGWSDEIVVSTGTGTHSDTSTIYNTNDLYVDWAMINNGSADASASFYTYLYVDGVYRTAWITNPPISPSTYYYVEDYNIGKLSAGSHTVETLTDPTMLIPEIDDSDNRYIKTISVNASPQSLQLTYPVNTTITSSDVSFQWQAYSGATKYVLVVDNNSGFGSPEINKEYTTTSSGTFSNYFPTNTYYWKVIAYNGSTYLAEAQSSFTYTPVDASTKPVFVPLYRLYNSSDKDHFYVTTQSQVDTAKGQGFNYEKIECYISDRKFAGSAPLMRLYSGTEKSHFYTTSESEKDSKITTGYAYEGVSGYVYNSSVQGLVALYHLYHSGNGDHFYTISQSERDNAKNSYGFQELGTATYVSPDGKVNPLAVDRPSASVGWGVNAASGALEISSYNHEDLSVNSLHMPFVFERYYNSNNAYTDGPLGYGWSHNYNVRLIDNGSAAIVQWGDGNDDFYSVSGNNYTPAEPGLYNTLVKEADPSVYTLTKKDQTKYTFSIDADSDYMREARLRSIIEKNGYSIQIWPDSLGRIEWIKDTNARQYNFYYTDSTAQAKVSRITDPIGRTLNFEYQNGYLTSFTNARGKNTTYQYGASGNSFGKLVQITLPKGNIYAVGYDSSGRVQTQQEGSNPAMKLNYDYGGTTGKTQVVDPLNKFVYYTHDTDFRLKRFEDSTGNIAETWYEDSRSQNITLPTKIKDQRGYYAYFTYDDRGNFLSKKNAKDETTSYTYDDKNNLTSLKDGRNNTTTYQYDADKRHLMAVIDPLNHTTSFTYDSYGQLASVTDAEGRGVFYTYGDSNRNLTEVKDGSNIKTTFTYDGVSRQVTTTDANGNTTTNSYDATDNTLSVTTPLNSVAYEYDDNDNPAKISYGAGQVVLFNYDEHDRLKEEIDPLSRKKSYLYDEFGHVKQATDAENHIVQYSYNSNNQLQTITYLADGSQVTFGYDANGNRTTMTDSSGTSTYTHDELNRLASYIHNYVGLKVKYNYDASGNLWKIIYDGDTGNKIVTYNYDQANRLTSIVDWNSRTTQYEYDRANLLKKVTLPNGTFTTYNYDAAKRLNESVNQKSSGVISSYRFTTFDGVGNPTSLDLTDVLPVSLSSANTASSYDNADQLQSSGTYSYIYDTNGNRIQKSGDGTTTAYGYDFENRLKEMVGGVHSSQFKYDGDGLRIAATRDSVETKYLLDVYPKLERPITDLSTSGTSYNIYGLGLLYSIDPSGNYYYYHYNYRGDTVAITDQSQNIVNKYRYDEFGHVMNNQVEGISNRFKFMGQYAITQEMDDLSFVRTRVYDSKEGRFLQKDPSGYGDGVNLYLYTANNPISYVDPSGNKKMWHFDRDILGARLIHIKDFLGTGFRFNEFGELVEHTGKIIEKFPKGKAWKALKYLKKVKSDYFQFLIILDAYDAAEEYKKVQEAPPGSIIMTIPTPLLHLKVLEPGTEEYEEYWRKSGMKIF